MANQEHLDILKQDVEAWSRWREEHPDINPDLREADLRYANLTRADLSITNLSRADLSDATLIGVCLRYANVIGANLATTMPLHRLAQLMGHGSLDTTMLYIQGTKDDWQQSVETITWR